MKETTLSTADHVKRMAASTHLETSREGNPVPVLRLEIRYLDSHVRTRAMGPDGRYTDSIGSNDLAEAILLIGQVVRFGETMNARKLRVKAARGAESVEAGRMVRLTADQIEFIRTSLSASADKLRSYSYEGQPADWVREHRAEHEAMFESLRLALGGS